MMFDNSSHHVHTAINSPIHKDTGPNAINVWKNVWQCSTDTPPVESDGGAVSVYIVYIMYAYHLLYT